MDVLNLAYKEGSKNISSSLDNHIVFSNYDIPTWLYVFMMELISYLMTCVSLFGMTSNILIIVIYVKIGFSESINISYCALGISDALYVTFVTWNAICFIPAFAQSDLPFIPGELVIPTSGASTDIFGQTTAWITAWISFERCLCVVFPLKVKNFVTRPRTLLVILTISFFIIVPLTGLNVVFFVFEFTHDTRRNRTLLKMFRRNSTIINQVNGIYFFYKSLFSNLLPLLVVLVSALYLTKQIQASATWRMGHSNQTLPGSGKSRDKEDKTAKRKYDKDMRIAKTVLLIAVAFIFLGTLSVVRLLITMIWSEFRPLSSYGKLYRLISRLSLLLSQINSSVNFLIYYRMGSKFRKTANLMFRFKKEKKSGNPEHASGTFTV